MWMGGDGWEGGERAIMRMNPHEIHIKDLNSHRDIHARGKKGKGDE